MEKLSPIPQEVEDYMNIIAFKMLRSAAIHYMAGEDKQSLNLTKWIGTENFTSWEQAHDAVRRINEYLTEMGEQ